VFSIFSKKNKPTTSANPIMDLACDMHSHLLPGIDDGSPDIETSLSLIGGLVDKGYKKFICTPHIYRDLYPNTPETIAYSYEALLPHVKEKFPEISISYAAEYYMDDYFDKLLQDNKKLLTVHEQWVLVEHSFLQPPQDLKEKLFNLQLAGYTPILAHPERYEFYMKDKKAYDSLFDIGCIFQLNILSLTGYYGKVPQELAKYLIEKKYVKLLGTDMHHQRHLQAFDNVPTNKYVQELIGQGNLLNSTF
jgi:protein-tyrosine phosphatase